jgi:hypothetical protein
MRRLVNLVAVLVVACGAQIATAGLITSAVTSSNANVVVTSVSGVGETAPVTLFGSSTAATGTITVALDVMKLHVPTVLTFNFNVGGANLFTDYAVTLVTRNLDASSNSGRMNGFDISSGPRTGAVISNGIAYPTAPVSNVFFVEFNGGDNITGGFRFGGLSGGGGTIGGPLETASSTFTYRVNFNGTTNGGTSGLNFVANPEPATLLLGSLVMAPAAWVVRRRRKAAAELESAPI